MEMRGASPQMDLHTEPTTAGGILRLTWAHPASRNAIDGVRAAALAADLEAVEGRSDVGVVVLGLGQRPFCSGWDLGSIASLRSLDAPGRRRFFEPGRRLLGALESLPVPAIAAVSGVALGFGCALLAHCDVVVAEEQALFGLPEIRHGFAPATVLPELVGVLGRREALSWALTGEKYGVQRALANGLIHETVPADQLTARAGELAETIAAADTAGSSVKRLAARLERVDLQDGRGLGVELAVAAMGREK